MATTQRTQLSFVFDAKDALTEATRHQEPRAEAHVTSVPSATAAAATSSETAPRSQASPTVAPDGAKETCSLRAQHEPNTSACSAIQWRRAAQARLDELWTTVKQRQPRRRWMKPELRFYRRRSDAGFAHLAEFRISINEDLLAAYPNEMLGETIAHELAHLIVFKMYGRKARSHGKEWQSVMLDWFAVQGERTHHFDLSFMKLRRQRRFHYHCGCQNHYLSTVRHRRARSGYRYLCLSCDGLLRYVTARSVPAE